MNKSKMTNMQRLQFVLDHHGADRSKWPAKAQELEDYIKQAPAAAKLYHEARALDQLLDQGALPAQDSSNDLQQAILADFAALHERKDPVVVPLSRGQKRQIYSAYSRQDWMSTAALAACFAVGIYLGGVGIGDWSLDLAGDLANLASVNDQFADIADAAMSSSFEEELL